MVGSWGWPAGGVRPLQGLRSQTDVDGHTDRLSAGGQRPDDRGTEVEPLSWVGKVTLGKKDRHILYVLYSFS